MSTQQKTTIKSVNSSTKWIDYSDDESGPDNSDSDEEVKHHVIPEVKQPQQTQQQQYSLEQVHGNMVWLLAKTEEGEPRFIKRKLDILRRSDERDAVRIFQSQEGDKMWDVLVPKEVAENLLTKGLEDADDVKFTIHKRNFNKGRDRNDNGERGQRGERRGRGDRRGRGRGGNRGEGGERRQRGERGERGERGYRGDGQGRGEKKKYVDKETGKQSDNKKAYQQRVNEEKDRQYTKKQSNLIGESLGNFRNRPLEERQKDQDEKMHTKQIQKHKEREHVKREEHQQKNDWKRKQTYDEISSEINDADRPSKLDKKFSEVPRVTEKLEQRDQPPKEANENNKQKQNRKVHYPREKKIDVNQQYNELSKLNKKFSDVRDTREHRKQRQAMTAKQMASGSNQEKEEDVEVHLNQKLPSEGNNQQPRNDKYRQDRDYKNNRNNNNYRDNKNRNYDRNQNKPQAKKYQQKKPVEEEAKKQSKKDRNNHYSDMLSDDSDN